jgi:hypothetical protein
MPSTEHRPHTQRPLGEIASVQAGYPSRGRIEAAADGPYRLLQARDVGEGGEIAVEGALRFFPEGNPDLYRLHPEDILLLARGEPHRAFLFPWIDGPILASSVFHIIRPHREIVLPAYLAWWLNSPAAQAAIRAVSGGTGISYLRRPAVEELVVSLPPFAAQHGIAEVQRLWRVRQSLQSRRDAHWEHLVNAVCQRAASIRHPTPFP